ncbi:hypothetical protein AAFF_G00098390 [Aldrovandia affinis]|uniref:Uncharacterized protein n=1 Tax=Aldrovandia affinis TaxID=143900 RepID=A0AAD7RV27_9TELE|nr:hypothetical protein AAFF_G00098390 [Aldrovandia affinis]
MGSNGGSSETDCSPLPLCRASRETGCLPCHRRLARCGGAHGCGCRSGVRRGGNMYRLVRILLRARLRVLVKSFSTPGDPRAPAERAAGGCRSSPTPAPNMSS